MKKNILSATMVFIIFASLTACAPANPIANVPMEGLPGFWKGFFHGLTVLPAYVGSFFMDVHFYAIQNKGVSYDTGFVLGVLSTIGGSKYFTQ